MTVPCVNTNRSRGTCQPRRKRRITKEDLAAQRKSVFEQAREYYQLQERYAQQCEADAVEQEFFGP